MLNEEIIDTMVRKATEAINNAYVNHTSMPVGACALTSDGTLYTGCSIDNASPNSYCAAEELAIYKAISEGKREFDAVAVIADTEFPFVPAGTSLQVMSEFEVQDVVMANFDGDVEVVPLDDLFPSGVKIRQNRAVEDPE